MVRPFYLPALALILICCQSPEKQINKFADAEHMKIAGFQDRRMPDSLYAYLNHPEARYRADAALAFGSLQAAEDVDRIGKLLLMDADGAVRKAAAFALGQIQHPSCERILLAAIVKEKDAEIVFEILQSYGKATRRWQLDPTAFQGDSVKDAGIAWSLYRAGVRGKTDSLANAVAADLLDKARSHDTRLGAAHYFSRGATDFGKAANAIMTCVLGDPSPSVRMAAALALGKIHSDSALQTLKEVIQNDRDSRVIMNATRALRSFPYGQIKNYLYELLRHDDVNVGIAASEILIETIPDDAWIEVSSMTNVIDNWRIQANLYEAALKAGRNKDLAAEVQRHFQQSSNHYQRAALLGSLKHYFSGYAFLEESLRGADTALIRSSAAGALVAMNQLPDFPRALTPRFASLYRSLFASEKDPAVLGTLATALADSTLGYTQYIQDAAFLRTAAERLRLPEHNEALQSIEAAIARLENRAPTPVKNDFNHPIEWDLVKTIPADLHATIRTSRGTIIIRLFVNEAPGSVSNFVKLAQADYFDDKNIHRVVPNFVVQTGCTRGDGWGSENYSIRSEFSPRRYRTGSVGMASAGKDTEGTQWFITHSPTPHLDGRYTLFAQVTEGQTVVDYLAVGDRIIDVEIEHFTDQ